MPGALTAFSMDVARCTPRQPPTCALNAFFDAVRRMSADRAGRQSHVTQATTYTDQVIERLLTQHLGDGLAVALRWTSPLLADAEATVHVGMAR